MANRMRPIHPGEILAGELEETGMSANALAKALGVPANRIGAIPTARRGIPAYRFKIGPAGDEERIALLRDEMGDDFTLFVDANQAYNVREAVEVSAMLADYGVAWLEEPVLADSFEDLAEVARLSAVPIGAGNSQEEVHRRQRRGQFGVVVDGIN